jgi:GNAT superfamily N-acetyltransferase
MADFDDLKFRTLEAGDLEGAVALSAEAGWNQTRDDWRLLIADGPTFAIEAPDGRLVATALAYLYERRVAWIAMVLVTAGWQRKGIATELMRLAVAACRENGYITGLDATPAGREVYLPLGFRDVYSFTRLEAEKVVISDTESTSRPIEPSDLDAVVAFDRRVSGMDRRPLLESLFRRRPERAFLTEKDGHISDIVLGRDGRRAEQMGPLLAEDAASARDLAMAALRGVEGVVFVDVLNDKTELRKVLEDAGFQEQRGYIRMLLDRDTPLDQVATVSAVTGPEFG